MSSSELRDSLRAKVFTEHKVKTVSVEFFGATIELRQPTMEDIVKAQANPDREAIIVRTLVDYAYVPGTDEKVFELGDAASLMKMPFGIDFLRVSKALEGLTEVNFLDKPVSSSVDQTTT